MKTGARNFPSRVHSANLISATNFGLIQCIFFIIEGVMPSTHWPFCFDGRSTNGQSARSSARNFLWNVANDFVVNPVPTFPAKYEIAILVVADENCAEMFARPLRRGVSANDEFLFVDAFEFDPCAASPAGFVNGVV